MKYLNQFHKESTGRMLAAEAEWSKSPISAKETVRRMYANLELVKVIESEYRRK